ncbi:glycosyl hydrolase 53 family protein [Hyphobacterium sp. CCMP332]|nr:glycosyl hydrolase 53 family protein [Hyphobacterium sp. CCMP332]
MGFTSWPYGPDLEDVSSTYSFISQNADIYCEHIDSNIPWSSWINDSTLPASFVNDIAFKKSNKIAGLDFLLSVSILNLDRSDLANDFDGNTPNYSKLCDSAIIGAYTKHLDYLITEFEPTYLVMSIEGNELLIHSPDKWDDYKTLMPAVRTEIKNRFPNLKITESFTLHNLFQPDVANPEDYIDEVATYANQLDFVGISFYPFFKGLSDSVGFQTVFDYLHSKINKPIVFAETTNIAENLIVPGLSLNISGNPEEQDIYLQVLLHNAQQHNYEFVIWWAHRDFDELWETFLPDVKDLGQIWRDTGLLDEEGNERKAYDSWQSAFKISK